MGDQIRESDTLVLEEDRISLPLLKRLLKNKHSRSFYLPGPLIIELEVAAREEETSVNRTAVKILEEWRERRTDERKRRREEREMVEGGE